MDSASKNRVLTSIFYNLVRKCVLNRFLITGILLIAALIISSLLISPNVSALPPTTHVVATPKIKVVTVIEPCPSNDGVDSSVGAVSHVGSKQKEDQISMPMHLEGAQALDRDLKGITVDVSYNLNVPRNWYESFETTSPSYNDAMRSLHGENIWEQKRENKDDNDSKSDPSLSSFLDLLGLPKSNFKMIGSPLDQKVLTQLIEEIKPKIFLEVGVFQGSTSIWVANYFKNHGTDFNESYVISMDTWLLDLRFAWNGEKSINKKEMNSNYFTGTSKPQGGYSTMYYHFIWNCIKSKTTHRIIPLPTASQNGAMALLSHGIRPDFIYLDASHSNPDVYIDYENFYTILRPGGVIAFDDIGIPAVKGAFDKLVSKYNLEVQGTHLHKQAYVYKTKEKYDIDIADNQGM